MIRLLVTVFIVKKIALELNIGLFIQKQNKKMIVKVTEV